MYGRIPAMSVATERRKERERFKNAFRVRDKLPVFDPNSRQQSVRLWELVESGRWDSSGEICRRTPPSAAIGRRPCTC